MDEVKRRPTWDEVRAKIQKNFPKERAALRWRNVSDNLMVSMCDQFAVEKHGQGDAARYTAKIRPNTVIGHRLMTFEKAKELCEQHASPLPLEPSTPTSQGS